MKIIDIELAITKYFNSRQNIIVPNVSWGFNIHECDLLLMTPARYLYEIEIKTSKQDLIKDKEKKHGHYSPIIKKLYFAIPEKLKDCIGHIPDRAGVIIVRKAPTYNYCREIRKAQINKQALALTDNEAFQIARLGALRIWALKKKIKNILKG